MCVSSFISTVEILSPLGFSSQDQPSTLLRMNHFLLKVSISMSQYLGISLHPFYLQACPRAPAIPMEPWEAQPKSHGAARPQNQPSPSDAWLVYTSHVASHWLARAAAAP